MASDRFDRPDREDATVGTMGELIGFSAAMQRVYSAIHKVSAYPYSVLICGERGTGKESTARSIHSLGPRKSRPFISLDCTTLSPTLFDADLFGYEKGAFVDANHTKWGLLSLVADGTLFLREVGGLSLSVQAKLLRTLEDGMFTPMGSASSQPFKARIIASTSSDIAAQVKRGTFREDLYLRLDVAQIDLPTLRERRSDIPLLVDFFIDKYTDQKTQVEFSSDAMNYLLGHDWPGNVGELEDTVRDAVSRVSGPVVDVEDLNVVLGGGVVVASGPSSVSDASVVNDIERNSLIRALRESGGDEGVASGRVGIGAALFRRRLKYHGLLPPQL
jgi:DNA-binding NtrC family response regulator